MAKKKSETKVTRITASDSSDEIVERKKPVKVESVKTAKKKATSTDKPRRSWGLLGSLGGYFKGAWYELRQVHWPTRKATWSLTGAVLAFTAFFVVFISLLDVVFKFMFEQLLK